MNLKIFPQTRTKRLFLGLCALIIGLSTPSFAFKGYHPPEDLYKEILPAQNGVAVSPNSAEAHFELAMVYAYTGYIEEGWDELKRVNEIDKNYAPTVVTKYESLTKAEPNNWKYKFKLAFGYYFVNQKEKGQEQFQKILDQHPDNIWAMGFLAFLKGESGDIADAIVLTKKAIAMEPTAPALHFLLGTAYIKKGDYLSASGEMMSYLSNRTRQKPLPNPSKTKKVGSAQKDASSAAKATQPK